MRGAFFRKIIDRNPILSYTVSKKLSDFDTLKMNKEE